MIPFHSQSELSLQLTRFLVEMKQNLPPVQDIISIYETFCNF